MSTDENRGDTGVHRKKVVVTGATGFVGSHAVLALQALNDPTLDIVAACRDPARLPVGFTGKIAVGDLRDPVYRLSLIEGANTLVHAAAWTSLYGHAQESEDLFLRPTLALLSDAESAEVPRIVFVSTTAAAPPKKAADPDSLPVDPGFWPHLRNVAAIEWAMRQGRSSNRMRLVLRFGLFVGARYGLGLLPVLVPRLKSHLVPWIRGGRTPMPLIAGEDIGQAIAKAVTYAGPARFHGFNLTGPTVPTVREVITYLSENYGLPRPHFSVPFWGAHVFAWLMEGLSALTPWNPFITRAIVYLLRDFHVDSTKATQILGYRARVPWQQAVDQQMAEMANKKMRPMPLAKPVRPSPVIE